MIKIDCASYARDILDNIKESKDAQGTLYILTAGDDPASQVYMKGKLKDAEYCGIPAKVIHCKTESEMAKKLAELRSAFEHFTELIGGIIVQLPLPEGWHTDRLLSYIPRELDVDGFQPDSKFKPCTPEAIVNIMKRYYGWDISGLRVGLIGKGKLIGKPLIPMLLDEGCTLTVMHSRTIPEDIEHYISEGEFNVLIGASTVPDLVDINDWSMPGMKPLLIDAGIFKDPETGKLHGNFHITEDARRFNNSLAYTPVPGGVGLLTRAILMYHVSMNDFANSKQWSKDNEYLDLGEEDYL